MAASSPPSGPRRRKPPSAPDRCMLRLRIITAVLLLAVLLPALAAAQAWPFALVTLVMIAAAGWEWGRLNQASQTLSVVLGLLLAAACAVALWLAWASAAPGPAWWGATVLWLLAAVAVLRAGPAAWPRMGTPLRWVLGLLALWAAWLALAQARTIGINFVLSVMALVWAADIAAYAGGKAFGRRKLAPTISPGKSWEGAVSGAFAVLLLAVLWTWIDRRFAVDSQSLYTRLLLTFDIAGAGLALLALSAMSVVGDLVESLVKRAAGAKDSSRLLPGHGGVLDRIDALLPVFPCAMALVSRNA